MDTRYDVIVIGSGLGGLTAAALLAKTGKKVLVLEQHDRPGGYAQAFTRRGYRFDSSIHFSGGCFPMEEARFGAVYATLELLNVKDACSFAPMNPFCRIVTPDFTFDIPSGIERFIEACARQCPADAARIRKLAGLCLKIDDELRRLPLRPSPLDFLLMPFGFPLAVRYGMWTLKQGLDHFLTDERAKAIMASVGLCYATPPSRLSFALWSHAFASLIHEQPSYCMGTFQMLADAFVKALETYGGTLALNTAVQAIETAGRKVCGIVTADGTIVHAPVVIANIDQLQAYGKLMRNPPIGRTFMRRLHALRPTMSAFGLYIATDLDMCGIAVGHETFIAESLDIDACFSRMEQFKPAIVLAAVPTLSDARLAPEGIHLISAITYMPYVERLSNDMKIRLQETIIGKLCTVVTGLKDRIIYCETAQPATYERYTYNLKGAVLGWEATPRQAGYNCPPQWSSIRGLYHAGHWTRPGGGVYGAIISGRQAAQLVCGYRNAAGFIEALRKLP